MMITCVVNGCTSTQNTRIDGKQITFFPFPEDDRRKNQWLSSCKLTSNFNEPLHLCELHFEKEHFTASKDLKFNAVPTLLGKIEESLKRQKAENTMQMKVLSKRKKLDEHSHALVTPPQSPSMHDNQVENLLGRSKTDASMSHATMNGSAKSTSITPTSQTNSKTYRLIIQIDKIRSKPGPRCKKILPLIKYDDILDAKISESGRKLRPLRIKNTCPDGSCKLRKCIYESRLAFKCEVCGKYFLAKTNINSYSCSKCFKTFSDLQSLSDHMKQHFLCDICLIECSSQVMYDKHLKLHASTDPLNPYKCHQCRQTFDLKDNVKKHCMKEHSLGLQNTLIPITSPTATIASQAEYLCMNCNINFTNEQAYRNHIRSHENKESIACNITSEPKNIIPVPNPITGNQIGFLQAVKFTCRVCSKEFDNVKDVDLHTRTHLKVPEEDLKCNICKKLFKSSTEFSEHLKLHLKHAHVCPICSKAFINKTSLNNHLKTHSVSV